MAKVWFHANGWRECKEWECPDCKNYWVAGMDLVVEENKKKHINECLANPEKKIAELKKKLEDTKRYVEHLRDEAMSRQRETLAGESGKEYYMGQDHVLGQILVWMNWK